MKESVGWDNELVWTRMNWKEGERVSTLFDPWRGGVPTRSSRLLRGSVPTPMIRSAGVHLRRHRPFLRSLVPTRIRIVHREPPSVNRTH